ncbi:ATP-dependent helicase/DNAse subunit B [Marininema mesophilum]|uniref:ATP-dependent helicase/DNAse subunit B n=1 Tax=Marininema mesophilum TaxID=1048340 RepID=A0A1H2VHG3_9BACL|nr:PD-(D/E)XK nuclease family protein [Marininema mesophilum]SDW67329.1 ATP-dependent helicase/DNAse subunit B [Marininema mesophilum]
MPGRLVLHPAIEANRGMGLLHLTPRGEQQIVYLVPGAQSVGEYRRIVHSRGLSEKQIQLTTFDAFVRELYPQSKKHLMTRIEQEWLARRAVEEGIREEPGYFQGMTDRVGWLKKVEARIGELKRAGVRPERLTTLWKHQGDGLPELARVFYTYDRLLKEHDLLDHEEPYFLVMDAIRKEEITLPTHVVAEQFPDLSFLQEQLLIQLITAGVSVELHLAWDEERPRLFEETKGLCDRLKRRGFEIEQRQGHKTKKRRKSLDHLARSIFATEPRREVSSDVEVIAAPGLEKEVTLVVARLKRWLRESGSPLNKVALVTNQANSYFPLLMSALEEAGIPCTRTFSRPLKEHPLIWTLHTALSMQSMKKEMIPLLLESPLLPWLADKSSAVSWTAIWQGLGSPERGELLSRRIDQITEDELQKWEISQEELVGMVDLFRWVEGVPQHPLSWNEWVAWFTSWVKPLDDRERRQTLARNPMLLPVMAEEWKAWSGLREIITTWQGIFAQRNLGEQMCDRGEFLSALEQAAEAKQIEGKPGRRGGIHLLEPNQVRGDRYQGVFLLGCVEGEWPRPIAEDWLVSDEERERLRREGVHLALAYEQRTHQLIPFFHCVSAAEEKLVLSYPASDVEGRNRLPSPYLDEVKRVYKPEPFSEEIPGISELLPLSWQVSTSLNKGLERGIALLGRVGGKDLKEKDLQMARRIVERVREERPSFIASVAEKIKVESQRQSEGKTSKYSGSLTTDVWGPEVAKAMKDQVWSVTQLNELMQCRFHFFAGRMVGARHISEEIEGLSPLEKGELLHRILCRFWDRYRRKSLPDFELAEEDLRGVANAVWQEFVSKDSQERDPLYLHIEKSRLIRKVLGMIRHEWSWREKEDVSDFRPILLEFGFGIEKDEERIRRGEIDPATMAKPVELPLANGERLRLKGKVDRVDQDELGRYILYDYKSGNAPDLAQIKEGAYLQLPLYLWAVQEVFSLDSKLAIGVAFFTGGKGKDGQPPTDNRNKGLWRKEEAKLAGISGRVTGLFPADEWEEVMNRIRLQLRDRLERVEKGDFAVEPTWECPTYCPHRGICRVNAYPS